MSWRDVARRDLRSSYRSRMGPSVAIVLLLSTVGVAMLVWLVTGSEEPHTTGSMVALVGSLLSFVVPLVALMASYSAIVGERTTGSVRFLLGLPNSRTDAYVGKFLSRTAVVVGPLLAGTVFAGALLALVAEAGTFAAFIGLALLSSWYAAAFVAVGLGASVLADTDTRAVSLVVAAFAILRAGWPVLQWVGLQSMRDDFPRPAWFFWVGRVNPINAYVKATTVLYGEQRHPLITTPEAGRFRGVGDASRESMAGTFVVSAEFSFLVLAVFGAAMPVLGWLYFRQRDVL